MVSAPLLCTTTASLAFALMALSTYSLLAASLNPAGVGTLGAAANCLTPSIVSPPLRCTTSVSLALVETTLSTYCFDASCDVVAPVPGLVCTAASVVGELVPTAQYCVFTVPPSNWNTTV